MTSRKTATHPGLQEMREMALNELMAEPSFRECCGGQGYLRGFAFSPSAIVSKHNAGFQESGEVLVHFH